MNKAVLISIQPKWCELIASGKKTIEVRKSKPTLETPFKCCIYETKGICEVPQFIDEDGHASYRGRGQVIGEFVCDRIYEIGNYWATNEIYSAFSDELEDELREEGLDLFDVTCLTDEEIIKYLGVDRDGYGWHISELKIYDKPKELSEFERPYSNMDEYEGEAYCDCNGCEFAGDSDYGVVACDRRVTRPPQSWCYVEEI